MIVRILIADDSPVIRHCVGRLLASHSDWSICAEAANGEEAVCKSLELAPDLVVLDFSMPKKNGIDAARDIRKRNPGIPILLFSMFLCPQLVDLAREAGVSGTVGKENLSQIIPCIETLLRGGTFFN